MVSERRATAAAEASGGPVTSPSSSANLTAAEKERNLVYTALASVLEAAGEWQAVRDADEAAGKGEPGLWAGWTGGRVVRWRAPGTGKWQRESSATSHQGLPVSSKCLESFWGMLLSAGRNNLNTDQSRTHTHTHMCAGGGSGLRGNSR